MLCFLGGKSEVAEEIAARRRAFTLSIFGIVSAALVDERAIAIARQPQLLWWRLPGPFLERVHNVHRFRERAT
jgi:hypothetical protein